ncbi:MAG: tetratricopeptide repeat protein [Chloroflexi bacterium]|nr:tetratricopeptide repeat protein [Chloroflexota bacterium]
MIRRAAFPIVVLSVLLLLAFAGVSDNGFVPYDDDRYVTNNLIVREGLSAGGLGWAFTSVGYASNWHPLTWLSHMADVQLFGLNPRRHHQSSVLLHLAGCLLLFHVLRSATGHLWRSFFAAALFAVHPLRVESVAWVAQRKDVLGFFFGMLTLAAWLAWLRRPESWRRYALVAGAFLAGLLSKPTLVMLPAAMLLFAWWPLGCLGGMHAGAPGRRFPRAATGVAWLFPPAMAVAVLSWLAQRAGGGFLDQAAPPLGMRLANALVSIVVYLGKVLLPRDLAVFYPFPTEIAPVMVAAAAILVAGICAATWHWRRRHPYVLIGWLWYMAMLLPTLGLVPIGAQAMADRYTYLPSAGLAVAFIWLSAGIAGAGLPARLAAGAGGAALILALLPATRAQVGVWRDGATLFSHALRVTRDNWHIEHEFGALLFNGKRYDEAQAHFLETLRLKPNHVLARYNLAGVLFWQGRTAPAVAEYREVLRLRPDFAEAHFRLARALAYLGNAAEALPAFEEALRLEPDHAGAAAGLRKALAALGRAGN